MAGVTMLAIAAAAATPRLGGGAALDVSLTRIVSALLLCILLAAVGAVLLRRGGGRIDLSRWRGAGRAVAGRRIAVLESRRISPHADLCLLRCDGREYLILSSATGQQVVERRDVDGSARA
ncbi:hypothetical protein [Sphingomonas sp. VNH70]|uniref:hypothetical protein n=1 Tax=Sphingomonas silueang TaxID=3156617 RepID=UPI0032B5F926